ncbi:CXAR protein, partial [Amia calva]|nr:CXAR protein [Amia calva]
VTVAMQITSYGPQTIQKAQGEQVTLGCTYTPAASDVGPMDIEWFSLSPDMTQKDTLILSYIEGQNSNYTIPSLANRLVFTARDPSQGDASITLSNLGASDTGTYQCKVKKGLGNDMRKITLVVMAPPSVPKCWVEGKEEEGAPVSMRCKSYYGSTPLSYSWFRESGGSIPPVAVQNPQTGEMLIKNHSQSYVGNYRCEASNAVGKQQCIYTLRAYTPVNRAGMIAGAVIGALLLLLLLLLLIWLLICCCNKRRYQKEMANEIREDAPPPASRPVTPNSSFRSVLGYRSHAGLNYNFVGGRHSRPGSSVRSSIYTEKKGQMARQPSSYSQPSVVSGVPSAKYSSKYGYPV